MGYLAEHRLDSTFTVRQNLRYGRAYTYVRYNDPGEPDLATQIMPRSTGYVHDVIGSFVVDNQVEANFNAAGVSRQAARRPWTIPCLALDGGIGFGEASDVDLATMRPLGPTFDPETNYSRYRQGAAPDRAVLAGAGQGGRLDRHDDGPARLEHNPGGRPVRAFFGKGAGPQVHRPRRRHARVRQRHRALRQLRHVLLSQPWAPAWTAAPSRPPRPGRSRRA